MQTNSWMVDAGVWLGFWGGLATCLLMLGQYLERHSRQIAELQEMASIRVFVAADRLDSAVFGLKVLSWRVVFVSFFQTVTIVIFGALTIASMILEVSIWNIVVDTIMYKMWPFLKVVIAIAASNTVPDLMSIIVTRIILRKISRMPSGSNFSIAVLIIVDAVCSVIFAVIAIFFICIVDLMFGIDEVRHAVRALVEIDFKSIEPHVLGGIVLSVITSVTTSIWLWIYLAGWGVSSVIDSTKSPVRHFGGVLAPAGHLFALLGVIGFVPYIIL